jgi:hypothetical protein
MRSTSGPVRRAVRRMGTAMAICAVGMFAAPQPSAAPAASTLATSVVSSTPSSSWQFDGRVRAAVVVGDTVYVGGAFSHALPPASAPDQTPVPRTRLAAIDLPTGALLPWDPQANGDVWALTASPDGSTIYAGGDFTTIGAATRKKVAAFLTADGLVTSWNAPVGGRVRTILATSDAVYIGGTFSGVGGKSQPRLARLNTNTGALDTTWRPQVRQIPAGGFDPSTGEGATCPPRCSPSVTFLALANSGDIYVGGHFGIVNGTYRNNAAEVSAVNGAATMAWDPNVFVPAPTNPNQHNYVYGIAASPATSSHSNRVFICGDFFRVGGMTTPNLAAVDAISGAYDMNWRASTDGGTPACVLGPDDNLYIGGHFRFVGGIRASQDGVVRNHAAALSAADPPFRPPDPATGAPGCYCVYPNSWNPNLNSSLGAHVIATHSDFIVVGGDFTKVKAVTQAKYAQFPVSPSP